MDKKRNPIVGNFIINYLKNGAHSSCGVEYIDFSVIFFSSFDFAFSIIFFFFPCDGGGVCSVLRCTGWSSVWLAIHTVFGMNEQKKKKYKFIWKNGRKSNLVFLLRIFVVTCLPVRALTDKHTKIFTILSETSEKEGERERQTLLQPKLSSMSPLLPHSVNLISNRL